MANFKSVYAEYYNLLYKDKDYTGEAAYIDTLIRKHASGKSVKLLDIGCGTGQHDAVLADMGYRVHGIDRSEEMIKTAENLKNPNLSFSIASAESFSFLEEFDVVVSLFHVMSYLTGNNAVTSCIQNVKNALKPGGLFIFDFWYGPAVLTQKPENRMKVMENENCTIHRFATPKIHPNDNVVDVCFDVVSVDKKTEKAFSFQEIHPMRYFFKPEIEIFLANNGLKIVFFEEFMSGRDVGEDTWGVCCGAMKI